MSTELSIQGTTPGPYYVMDNSGLYPQVCSVHGTLRLAQRSTLCTADALAFDLSGIYTAPPQGDA
jgi:hypothetical protein